MRGKLIVDVNHERFHQTVLSEFYRVTCRKKIDSGIGTLQTDLEKYMLEYNTKRSHEGKRCQGKTLMETFIDDKKPHDEKNLTERMAAA